MLTINNSEANTIIGGSGDGDYIVNHGDYSSINAGDGNDLISNWRSSNITVIGSAGSDHIINAGHEENETVYVADSN